MELSPEDKRPEEKSHVGIDVNALMVSHVFYPQASYSDIAFEVSFEVQNGRHRSHVVEQQGYSDQRRFHNKEAQR
jgi:hypothetical protein